MSASKTDNKEVLDLTRDFLTALKERKPWQEFAQLRTRKMQAPPNLPTFSAFKVLSTKNPGGGRDPEVIRAVYIEITIGGNDRLPLQVVMGKLLAVKECDWNVCTACAGKGETEEEQVCPPCKGTGRTPAAAVRIPEKGTETYEHDMEHGVWGVCPTSFSYVPGTGKRVQG